MSEGPSLPGKPRALEAILLGWLAVGVLDMLDAYFFFGLRTGASFLRVFQGVAGGLYGREAAIAGGDMMGWIGLGLHYVIALGVSVVFYLLCTQFKFLYRQPFIWGPIYGIGAHLFMQYVVIPNSAIGSSTPFGSVYGALNGFIGHALLVGLPVALINYWSAKRNNNGEQNDI